MKVGDKVRFNSYASYREIFGDAVGTVLAIAEREHERIGVHFNSPKGHDLQGRVTSGGWWCEREDLIALPPEVDKEYEALFV